MNIVCKLPLKLFFLHLSRLIKDKFNYLFHPSVHVPFLSVLSGLYYGVSICLVSFASGLAVVTLNLHHRGVRGIRVPSIVRSLVLNKLARIVFLNFQEENRSVKRMHVMYMHIVPCNTPGILQITIRFLKTCLNTIKLGQCSVVRAFLGIRLIR